MNRIFEWVQKIAKRGVLKMKWTRQDLKSYIQAKAYVDTVLVPLIPVSFEKMDEDMIAIAFQKEVLDIMVLELEKEFKGRILALPPYIYESIDQDEVRRLNRFTEKMDKLPFRHIFYISFDQGWKVKEKDLDGTLIWIPVAKDGDIHAKVTQNMVKDHIQQIRDLIKNYWNS